MNKQPNKLNQSSVKELDFTDKDTPGFKDLVPAELEEEDDTLLNRDLNPPVPGGNPTNDDLAPETLIKEDGANSSQDDGDSAAADADLTIVNENEIGAGKGLDEAELAHKNPLNKKR